MVDEEVNYLVNDFNKLLKNEKYITYKMYKEFTEHWNHRSKPQIEVTAKWNSMFGVELK